MKEKVCTVIGAVGGAIATANATMSNGSFATGYGYYVGDWYYVESQNGNTGYCHKDYLDRVLRCCVDREFTVIYPVTDLGLGFIEMNRANKCTRRRRLFAQHIGCFYKIPRHISEEMDIVNKITVQKMA